MKAIGTLSTIIVAILIVVVVVNWDTIRLAWKYRTQIRQAAEVGGTLQQLGVF